MSVLRYPKELLRFVLRQAGFELFDARHNYASDGLFTLHSDRFREALAFRNAYSRGIAASQGVDPHFEWRVHVALWVGSRSLSVPGDFVECGVNAGFISSSLMHYLDWSKQPKRFFLVDTFSGPVLDQFSGDEVARGRRTIAEAAIQSGGYVTDVERVRANFAEWPNAVIVPGSVPEVLAGLPVEKVAFLHIDMNCAYPERAALEFFWDRLSSGAFVLFDDYTHAGHEQQADAIDAAARTLGADVLALPTGQGLISKP